MRRALQLASLLFAVLLIAGPTCAQTHVQDYSNGTAGGPLNITVTPLAAATNTDFVVRYNRVNSLTTAFTDTDSTGGSNTWTAVEAIFNTSPSNDAEQMFYNANIAGSPTSYTTTVTSNGGAIGDNLGEFSGVAATTPVDCNPVGSHNASATSSTTPTCTTANANDLVVACIDFNGTYPTGQSVANGPGAAATWTMNANNGKGTAPRSSCAYAIVAATGSYSATFSWTGAVDTDVMTAAFKKAAAGATCPKTLLNLRVGC